MTRILLAAALTLALATLARAQDKPDDKVEKAVHDAHVRLVEALLGDAPAEQYVAAADDLKSEDRFEEAAVYYLVALKMKPRLTRASYQLACNFALWGQERLALRFLAKAVDDGFWGYEVMKDDDDLRSIRDKPEVAELMKRVKARYDVEAPKHAGGMIVKLPAGTAPEKGWPVLVILHGYGSNKENMAELAALAAAHGVAGVSLSGPVVMDEGSYRWPTDAIESTHAVVQKALAELRAKNEKVDGSRVFLSGFSQGALHAALLVATQPVSYAGALAISPGGTFDPPYKLAAADKTGKLFLVGGGAEHPGNKETLDALKKTWDDAKRPVKVSMHAGGHHFPEDWRTRFAEALAWLQAG